MSTTQVFVQHDAIWPPLQQPNDGPSKVLSHKDKHFTWMSDYVLENMQGWRGLEE